MEPQMDADERRLNEITERVIQAAFHLGLLLLGCGPAGIRICPALCVTPAEVIRMLELLAAACRKVPG